MINRLKHELSSGLVRNINELAKIASGLQHSGLTNDNRAKRLAYYADIRQRLETMKQDLDSSIELVDFIDEASTQQYFDHVNRA